MNRLWVDKAVFMTAFLLNQGAWYWCNRYLLKKIEQQNAQCSNLYDFTKYLCHMLEERGIEIDLTEFDVIALGFFTNEYQSAIGFTEEDNASE